MSSSISSFRAELRVVAVVALVLLTAEVAMRFGEPHLSRDVQHIEEIPAISQSVATSKTQTILFLGNSQVRAGIDTAVIEQELRAKGVAPVQIERVYPDSTSLSDWYHVFQHYFVRNSSLPKVLVLCFSDVTLQDNRGVDPTRLGHYFGASEIPEIFRDDVHEFESRAELMAANLSFAFANRMRVRTRALDALVPEYRETAQRINRDINQHIAAALTEKSYARLKRFLAMAKQNGVHVVFVAMPLPVFYSLDPQIKSIVEGAGMSFFDCRKVNGIDPQSFADEMHLTNSAAIVYSHFLGSVLAGPISEAKSREYLMSSR